MKNIISFLFIFVFFLVILGCDSDVKNRHPSQIGPGSVILSLDDSSNDKVNITWKSDGDAQEYMVFISSNSAFPKEATQIMNTRNSMLELDPGIPGEVVYIKVSALWAGMESESSNVIEYRYLNKVTASIIDGNIELVWTGDADKFNIYWSTKPDLAIDVYEGYIKNIETNRYTHIRESLPAQEVIYYLITSIENNSESPIVSLIQVNITAGLKPSGPLTAPENVTASVIGSEIVISWEKVAFAKSYILYRQSNGEFDNVKEYSQSNLTSPFIDKFAVAGEVYYYWVAAKNSESISINSKNSNIVSLPNNGQIPITDNQAPILTIGRLFTIPENTTEIVKLTAFDSDADQISFSLSDETKMLFEIRNDNMLTFKESRNYESVSSQVKNNSYNLQIIVSDGEKNSSKNITVNIDDVNETPINNMMEIIDIAENIRDVGVIDMTDPEGERLNFNIIGGVDQDKFIVDSVSGQLQFKSTPDFENPTDDGQDNIYNVFVSATDDSGLSTSHTMDVVVLNINEAPYLTAELFTIDENSTDRIRIPVVDPEGEVMSFYVSGIDDSSLFVTTSGDQTMRFLSSPDFENPHDRNRDNRYQISVVLSDGENLITYPFSVIVLNINDNVPKSKQLTVNSINENIEFIANLTVSDADGDVTIEYSIVEDADGHLFEVSYLGDVSFISAPDYENPMDIDGDNLYQLSFRVSDGRYVIQVDWQVNVTNALAVATPEIQKISYVGEQVVLHGSSSIAAEPSDPIIEYEWKQLSGPVVEILNASSANASYLTPMVTSPLDMSFSLTVTSGEGNTVTSEIMTQLQPYSGQYILDIANEFPSHIIGTYWGGVHDLSIDGNSAYLGTSNGLKILDISDVKNPVLMGSINTPGTARKAVVKDNIVYLADFTGGLQIIDVSDATNPQIIGSLQTPGNTLYVEVLGNFAYVADSKSGILVIDISNPEFPVIATTIDTKKRFARFQIINGKIYFGYGCYDLRIVDVSDPATVLAEGSLSINYCGGEIFVAGDYAYVADRNASDWISDLNIIDISDVNNFFFVSRMNNLNSISGMYVEADKAYIAISNQSLQIVDVSDKSKPEIITTISTPYTTSSVVVQNQIAYVADSSAGLFIMDVSDLAYSPVVGDYLTPGRASHFKVQGNIAYISDSPYGLHMIDISRKDQLQFIARLDTPGKSIDLDVSENTVYLADYKQGLSTIDVSNPQAPVLFSTYNPALNEPYSFAMGVTIKDSLAYLSLRSFGLYAINTNLPTSLYTVSLINTNGLSYSTKFVDDNAFVANGTNGLQIVNYSNINKPLLLGALDTLEYTTDVDVQNNIAYLAADRPGLKIVNVANLLSPVLLGTINTPGEVKAVKVRESRAFLADGEAGIQIADISSSVSPRIIGHFNSIYVNDIDYINGDVYFVSGKGLSIVNPYIELNKQYDDVNREEVLQYSVSWTPDPTINRLMSKCWVTSGRCDNVLFDADNGVASFDWVLQSASGKHEIIMGVGNESYFLTQLDRVNIR